MYDAVTSAPPPTPSVQQSDNTMSTSAAADSLSRMLHRLPPTLSLPTRRAPPGTRPPVPVVSLSQARSNPSLLLSSKHGFFQLTDHSIPPELADSAESEALSLFDLTREKKEECFPRNWPVGFEEGDEVEDDDEDGLGESFCLDESCYTEAAAAEMSLDSLSEFTRVLEKVGLEVIELLCRSVGFESPLGKGDLSPTGFCSMIWVAEGLSGKSKTPVAGRFYPYVVGLQYQIRSGQKWSLLADSGWVTVAPQVESVLVTVGDIAQVWSNGELKKVRGRPVAGLGVGEGKNKSRCVSMSLLVTLPIDTKISPVLPAAAISSGDHSHKDDDNDQDGNERNVAELGDHNIKDSSTGENKDIEGSVFQSFCLEDYAWRVYHERLYFKDPLDRFRIKN